MKDYTGEKVTDFLSLSNDIRTIAEKIIKDDKICKLLYYTTEDSLEKIMSEEEKVALLDKYIITNNHFPEEDNNIKNFIMIDFDHFTPSENPAYMACAINFTIFCHIDNWKVKERSKTYMRLYYLAHEVLTTFSESKMTGIGKLEYMGGESMLLGTDTKYKGVTLSFNTLNSMDIGGN